MNPILQSCLSQQTTPKIQIPDPSLSVRYIAGTDIIATPAETFRLCGYTPERLIKTNLPEEKQLAHLRAMYQPLFILTHAQDRLRDMPVNHTLKQNNKACYNRVSAIFTRFFNYLFSGPSMKSFSREITEAQADLTAASSPKEHYSAQARLDRAFAERDRALRYFDELDFSLKNIFHDFDLAAYGSRNILAPYFSNPDTCRLYADIIAIHTEVQIAISFSYLNLGIQIDPQIENLYNALRIWASSIYDRTKLPDQIHKYWTDVYNAYINQLVKYTKQITDK